MTQSIASLLLPLLNRKEGNADTVVQAGTFPDVAQANEMGRLQQEAEAEMQKQVLDLEQAISRKRARPEESISDAGIRCLLV